MSLGTGSAARAVELGATVPLSSNPLKLGSRPSFSSISSELSPPFNSPSVYCASFTYIPIISGLLHCQTLSVKDPTTPSPPLCELSGAPTLIHSPISATCTGPGSRRQHHQKQKHQQKRCRGTTRCTRASQQTKHDIPDHSFAPGEFGRVGAETRAWLPRPALFSYSLALARCYRRS